MNKPVTKPTKPLRSGPLPAAALRRAEQLAPNYSVSVQSVDGGWLAKCIELPTAFTIAETPERAVKAVRRPIVVLLATLIELERAIPAPLTERKREAQVNVKLTVEERMVLESAAKAHGFKGLSDFFRHAALQAARRAA